MPIAVSENITERITRIAEEVAREPLYVVEVSVRGQQGSHVVDIYVDSDEVLTIESLTAASREIGFLLETQDVIDGKYKLNVSSPGVDRPLTIPRQYAKNVGRKVVVRWKEPGQKPARGTIIQADDQGFEIELENRETKSIAYGDAKEVKILLPW